MQPFLKWAGGKRWLFDKEFISTLPAFERYVEPFLGGGAGFFAIRPHRAVLNDINPELIELYEVIRDHPNEIRSLLTKKQALHSREFFYKVRSSSPFSKIERAARTLYLNRTCWNGLYRLNRNGSFNVPIGTKTAVLLDNDDFQAASELLQRAQLNRADFEDIIDQSGEGDLVFADPPYTVKHNMNGFVKYNEKLFAWGDQVRLKNALVRASSRGAAIILTNADHDSVAELYSEVGEHLSLTRASVISGRVAGRSETSELLIRL